MRVYMKPIRDLSAIPQEILDQHPLSSRTRSAQTACTRLKKSRIPQLSHNCSIARSVSSYPVQSLNCWWYTPTIIESCLSLALSWSLRCAKETYQPRHVKYVGNHLLGERSGKRIGIMFCIVVRDVEDKKSTPRPASQDEDVINKINSTKKGLRSLDECWSHKRSLYWAFSGVY